MTDETGAAAPVDEQAVTAPAENEQATQTASVPEGAETENAETQETEQTEGDEQADEPKRLTRNQRLQRKAARLSTMVAEQAAELERLRQSTEKSSTESEPKEADYNGDWTKYQADYAAWKATQNIRGVLDEREQRQRKAQLEERTQEAVEDFLERVESVKTAIPDYDKAINAFAKEGGKFEPHVIEEIRDSEKGPQLAYYLAKNPGLAAELNAMSARDAAREIGRLEAKVSLPQPKRQTQAPAPLTALNGGASPSRSIADLAKSEDVSALISQWRKKGA